MPTLVIGAVAAGVVGGFSAGIAAGVLAFSTTAALVSGGISLVLGGLSMALAPKPPKFDAPTIKSSGITRQVRQAITSHKIVYGEQRVSGPIVLFQETSSNKYLHMVVVLAAHEVEEIGEIWLNDYSIAPDHLDGSGNVNTGRYNGVVRIKKHLGTDGQAADSDLVNEVTEWTSNHRLRGKAYLYIRMKFDRDKFPSGIPNVSAWVKGKKILDPRDDVTRYTSNIALYAHDYLTNDRYGFGASSPLGEGEGAIDDADANPILDADGGTITARTDSAFTDAAANICDEIVQTSDINTVVLSVDISGDILTLTGEMIKYQTGDRVQITTTGTAPAGLATGTNYYIIVYQRKDTARIKLATSLDNALAGTAIDITDVGTGTHTIQKNGEPRYHGGGVVDTSTELKTNIERILSGMAGRAIYTGGEWYLLAGAYSAPSITLSEKHFIGPITASTSLSKAERFNTVKGTYVSPINNGQPADYPIVTNSTYKTDDLGKEIIRDLDLEFTTRAHTAQRIAKIELEKARQEISFNADFNLHAMQLRTGDTVYINNTRFGWSSKIFEITEWKLSTALEDSPRPVVNMTLRETATTVYDWNNGEETAVDPAPNTNLPNAFDISAPVGLSVDSLQVETKDGDKVFNVILSWEAHENTFVISRGAYEIEYKKSAVSDWTKTSPIDGEATTAFVFQGELGTNYDIRIRAINQFGVRSSYSQLSNFVVGTAGGVTATQDWGNWVDVHGTTQDWGDWTGSVTVTDDWGGFV